MFLPIKVPVHPAARPFAQLRLLGNNPNEFTLQLGLDRCTYTYVAQHVACLQPTIHILQFENIRPCIHDGFLQNAAKYLKGFSFIADPVAHKLHPNLADRAKDLLFGFIKRGFLFLSGLAARPISGGIQAWQKGAPSFPGSDHHGRHKPGLQ